MRSHSVRHHYNWSPPRGGDSVRHYRSLRHPPLNIPEISHITVTTSRHRYMTYTDTAVRRIRPFRSHLHRRRRCPYPTVPTIHYRHVPDHPFRNDYRLRFRRTRSHIRCKTNSADQEQTADRKPIRHSAFTVSAVLPTNQTSLQEIRLLDDTWRFRDPISHPCFSPVFRTCRLPPLAV
jgi:hypothetical protein